MGEYRTISGEMSIEELCEQITDMLNKRNDAIIEMARKITAANDLAEKRRVAMSGVLDYIDNIPTTPPIVNPSSALVAVYNTISTTLFAAREAIGPAGEGDDDESPRKD